MPSVEDYQLPDFDDQYAGNRYSRTNGSNRYATMVEKSRRRGRVAKIIGGLVLVALVIAGVWLAVSSFGITKQPFYMLLLGTDESIERNNDMSENSLQGVYRTDTMILARIDPVTKKATLLSLPRDTRITLPGHGTQKLNAAYALGGMDSAVSTVEDLSGVHIAHTAIVDMDGLAQVVDAVGGIELEVPVYIDDEDAQGYLEPGWQTLNGQQALVLCRARNVYEEYDAPDLMRAANQRLVLQAIARKILASDTATQADAASKLASAVDTDLNVAQIVALMNAFTGMDTSTNLYTGVMPTTSVYEDDLWYEVVNQPAWQSMLKRVNQGLPPEESYEEPAQDQAEEWVEEQPEEWTEEWVEE